VVVANRDIVVRVNTEELSVLREGLELIRERLESMMRQAPRDGRPALDAKDRLDVVSDLETMLDDVG
jgi:hypothetical protein